MKEEKEKKIKKEEYKTPLKIKLYQNKNKIIISSIITIGLIITFISYHYIFILKRPIQKKEVKTITIEQFNKKVTIKEKKDLQKIYDGVYERRIESNHKMVDRGYYDESDTITLTFNNSKLIYFFYKYKNKYYEESFSDGIHQITRYDYQLIKSYLK